jgi:hypothetical protein
LRAPKFARVAWEFTDLVRRLGPLGTVREQVAVMEAVMARD